MNVSIPMVMNNHGTVCIEQTQVLNSKGIDPGSHVLAMIIVIVMVMIIVVVVVVVTMGPGKVLL